MIDERDIRAQRHGFSTHRDRMRAIVAMSAAPARPSHCVRCGRKLSYTDEATTVTCAQCGHTAPLAARVNEGGA